MDAAPAAYHPSDTGHGADSSATQDALDFPPTAATNQNTTELIMPVDLGDTAAAAAAAAAAATAATGNPLNSPQPIPGTLPDTQPGPSPSSMLPSPPSARGTGGTTTARGTTTASARESKPHKINTEKLFCQVEDCRAPLEGLKDYHQRYKVCDIHLKIQWIERDGIKIRFCQQCGRFQPLEEFDDMKRSCRARLQKHNARRRKRTRDGGDVDAANAAAAAALGHHGLHDPAAQAAIAAGFNATEVAAMQEAMQFASATLMQTTAAAGALNVATNNAAAMMHQPANVDIGAASASASIAGMPFGGALQSMPFIPSKEVMTLLLKGYAGMFHYTIENLNLKSRAPPTTAEELAAPMEAAAAAAAAAMTAAGMGGMMMPGDESAAAHLMAIQSQQAAEAVGAAGGAAGGGGGEYVDPSLAAAAAAAAMVGTQVDGAGVAGIYNPGSNDGQGQQQHEGHVNMNAPPPSIQ